MTVKVKFDKPVDGLTKGIKAQMEQDEKYEKGIKKGEKKSGRRGSRKEGK